MVDRDLRAQRLERTLAQGRTRFILLRGVLGWGLTTGVAWSVLTSLTLEDSNLGVALPLALIMFPLGGYFWGAFMWRFLTKQNAKRQEQQPN